MVVLPTGDERVKKASLAMLVVAGLCALCVPLGYHLAHSAPRRQAPSPPAPPVRSVFRSAAELETVAGDYIARHGLMGFMDELYNLVGTKAQADLTNRNHALARTLGFEASGHHRPLTVDKAVIREVLPQSRIDADRRFLGRFFARVDTMPDLGKAQRLFLEWHFSAPPSYSSVLHKPDRRVVVGWNIWAELGGSEDFEIYTFGQLGCTSVFAVASDGAVHLSHYDDVVNRTQAYVLFDFLNRHGKAELYVNGVYARELARFLRAQDSELDIHVYVKKTYTESIFATGFLRSDGRLSPLHCERPVSTDYLPSVVNGEYGRWFPFGRFSQAFCGADADFVRTPYEVFDKPPSSPSHGADDSRQARPAAG